MSVVRGDSLDDAIAAYKSQGFIDSDHNDPEPGFEKVAIYAVKGRDYWEWTHFARLRPDGWWESKIGEFEDIIHRSTNALAGQEYGTVRIVLKRTLADRIRRQLGYRKQPPQGLSLSAEHEAA